jgi:hypothetical protein
MQVRKRVALSIDFDQVFVRHPGARVKGSCVGLAGNKMTATSPATLSREMFHIVTMHSRRNAQRRDQRRIIRLVLAYN